MKTFLIAILFFFIWLVVGWAIGFKVSLNMWYDSLVNQLKQYTNLWTDKLNKLLKEQKEKAFEQLEEKKQEIIENIKQSIKAQLEKEIDRLFSSGTWS